jgi:excisionase family DNA binding protein
MQRSSAIDDQAAMSIKHFCEKHDVSEPTVYRQIALGKLQAKKVGRKTLITAEAAATWLAGLPPLSATTGLAAA